MQLISTTRLRSLFLFIAAMLVATGSEAQVQPFFVNGTPVANSPSLKFPYCGDAGGAYGTNSDGGLICMPGSGGGPVGSYVVDFVVNCGADPKGVADSSPALNRCFSLMSQLAADNNSLYSTTLLIPPGLYALKTAPSAWTYGVGTSPSELIVQGFGDSSVLQYQMGSTNAGWEIANTSVIDLRDFAVTGQDTTGIDAAYAFVLNAQDHINLYRVNTNYIATASNTWSFTAPNGVKIYDSSFDASSAEGAGDALVYANCSLDYEHSKSYDNGYLNGFPKTYDKTSTSQLSIYVNLTGEPLVPIAHVRIVDFEVDEGQYQNIQITGDPTNLLTYVELNSGIVNIPGNGSVAPSVQITNVSQLVIDGVTWADNGPGKIGNWAALSLQNVTRADLRGLFFETIAGGYNGATTWNFIQTDSATGTVNLSGDPGNENLANAVFAYPSTIHYHPPSEQAVVAGPTVVSALPGTTYLVNGSDGGNVDFTLPYWFSNGMDFTVVDYGQNSASTPINVAAASVGPVSHTSVGTGPFITAVGNATSVYSFIINITTGGPVGTAYFSWSSDGGSTYTSNVQTASTVTLGSTGVTIGFPSGTYEATPSPDVYIFATKVWRIASALSCLYGDAGAEAGVAYNAEAIQWGTDGTGKIYCKAVAPGAPGASSGEGGGGGGITALTQDLACSGSGSVACPVVQITGDAGLVPIISGTNLDFKTGGNAVSVGSRLNFQGEAAETYMSMEYAGNPYDLMSTDGTGDIDLVILGPSQAIITSGGVWDWEMAGVTSIVNANGLASEANLFCGSLSADLGGGAGSILQMSPVTTPSSTAPATANLVEFLPTGLASISPAATSSNLAGFGLSPIWQGTVNTQSKLPVQPHGGWCTSVGAGSYCAPYTMTLGASHAAGISAVCVGRVTVASAGVSVGDFVQATLGTSWSNVSGTLTQATSPSAAYVGSSTLSAAVTCQSTNPSTDVLNIQCGYSSIAGPNPTIDWTCRDISTFD